MESVRTPIDLVGHKVGPVEVAITADRVALYVDTTGADPVEWQDEAPPGFASVLLFAVADEFLYHPDVIAYTATLLHLDQSFTYLAPMAVGSIAHVEGEIVRVRERSGSYFVTFDANASADGIPVVASRSTFVLSNAPAPEPERIRNEPPVRARAKNHGSERSASRHDLVRYAAATRDFNPLHWDHDFAVASGLEGIVVHGLLMHAWIVEEAAAAGGGRRVASSQVRFRSALFPGDQASIGTVVDNDRVSVVLSCGEDQLVTGTVGLGAGGG